MKVKVCRKLFWSVKLVGNNGETIMVSETYHSRGNANRAANKIRRALGIS